MPYDEQEVADSVRRGTTEGELLEALREITGSADNIIRVDEQTWEAAKEMKDNLHLDNLNQALALWRTLAAAYLREEHDDSTG